MKLTRLNKIVINILPLIGFIVHFGSVIETRDSKTIILSFSAYLVGALTFAMIMLQFVFGSKPKSSEPSESEPDQPEPSEPSDPELPITYIKIPDHKIEYRYRERGPWIISDTDLNVTRARDIVDNRRKQLAREMDAKIFHSLMELEPKPKTKSIDQPSPESVSLPGSRRNLL